MHCNTCILGVPSPGLFQPLTVLFETLSMGAAKCLGLTLEPDTGESDEHLRDTQPGSDRTGTLLETQRKVVSVSVYRHNF